MEISDLSCVAPVGDALGEAAVWSASDGCVYWADICRFLIHRFKPSAQTTRSWHFDEPVVALALTSESGRFLVALASRLIWWWPESDKRVPQGFVLSGFPSVRFNDGRADPLGNFWIGTMRNNVLPDGDVVEAGGTLGVMYRVTPAGDVTEHIHGLGIANTLCWNPGGTIFYTADTLQNAVWAYEFDPQTAELGLRTPFLMNYPHGLPDGSAMDAHGFLWNCRFGGQSVVRVAPNGSIDRVVQIPVKDITTACFGGEDLKTLYITTAAVMRHPGERLAGSLWAMRCDVPGLPENKLTVRSN